MPEPCPAYTKADLEQALLLLWQETSTGLTGEQVALLDKSPVLHELYLYGPSGFAGKGLGALREEQVLAPRT